MIVLRVLLALFTIPLVMLLTLNSPKWLEVLVALGCAALAVAQIFYPSITKYLLLSYVVAAALQYFLSAPNNPTSWH